MGYQTKELKYSEIRTKDGTQYIMTMPDLEVSGFISSKSKSAVERIIRRIMSTAKEPPPNVAMAADRITDYVATMITLFGSDYVSASATLRVDGARLTLHIYITRYSDENEKVDEWRGYAEALIEDEKSRHLVKKRVVHDAATGVSGFALYRTLMHVARHAYSAVQKE